VSLGPPKRADKGPKGAQRGPNACSPARKTTCLANELDGGRLMSSRDPVFLQSRWMAIPPGLLCDCPVLHVQCAHSSELLRVVCDQNQTP
jgi:hypothetical protein